MMAYFPMQFQSDERLKGAPSWVMNKKYDIIAKVAPEDMPKWQKSKPSMFKKEMLNTMLQAALAERCKLVLHQVQAEIPGIALEVKKSSKTKLKLAQLNQPPPDGAGMSLPDGGRALFSGKDNRIEWTFYQASMTDLIAFLQMTPHTPIQNNTGLNGKYDFVLSRQDMISPDDFSTPRPDMPWDLDVLGLKLRRTNIQTETLVIDHIERPSEN
jgi:uncharacterized protein (TIGR03435 family)